MLPAAQYPSEVKLASRGGGGEARSKQSYLSLFNKTNRRATILASVPWFLQDLGTYGIGIFTPTILAAAVGANSDHARSVTDLIANDITAAKGAALITSLLIVGIIFAVLLADTVGRISLQIVGFLGCAVGLVLAALASNFTDGTQMLLIFSGFMLFNFMTNLGPNAQTYLLAGEVFPTATRGRGCRLRGGLCQGGSRHDSIPVPDSPRHHRDVSPALRAWSSCRSLARSSPGCSGSRRRVSISTSSSSNRRTDASQRPCSERRVAGGWSDMTSQGKQRPCAVCTEAGRSGRHPDGSHAPPARSARSSAHDDLCQFRSFRPRCPARRHPCRRAHIRPDGVVRSGVC
jgi:hypothetical protein